MPICQQDLPLDWYQDEFRPYAEEYLALPDRLPGTVTTRLARDRAVVDSAQATLMALGQWATLDRGYAIVRDTQGVIVRDATVLAARDRIDVRLARGSLDARVEAVRDSGA